jgi:carbon storage regulator
MMLVLSRKPNERVMIGKDIRITVVSISGHQVHLGIEAPSAVPIAREELLPPPPPGAHREGFFLQPDAR